MLRSLNVINESLLLNTQVTEDFDDDDMSIEAATQRARAQRLGAGVNRKLISHYEALRIVNILCFGICLR
jgi:hypothetical protein